jgi:hypothetical protein
MVGEQLGIYPIQPDFSPVKSTEVIMAAVDSQSTIAVNLALHRLLSFNEVGKNIFVLKAHEDIPSVLLTGEKSRIWFPK